MKEEAIRNGFESTPMASDKSIDEEKKELDSKGLRMLSMFFDLEALSFLWSCSIS